MNTRIMAVALVKRSSRMVVAIGGLIVVAGSASAGGQSTHTVELWDYDFMPRDVAIRVGDTVHWDWVSGFHNVESGVGGDHDGNFHSGDPTSDPDTTFDLVFDQAFLDAHPMPGNRYPYYCIIHFYSGMSGSITVQISGDTDADGDVDLDDYGILRDCMAGPASGRPERDCTEEQFDLADMNEDGHVDLKDMAEFQNAFSG